jgi:hypothetical protein
VRGIALPHVLGPSDAELGLSGTPQAVSRLTAHIAQKSVKSYIRAAHRRVGVATPSQAVGWGVKHGFGTRC